MLEKYQVHDIVVRKKNGEEAKGIKAHVQSDIIVISLNANKEMKIPAIEAGDIIEHNQSNGVLEQYEVSDPNYIDTLPAHVGNLYKCSVRKLSSVERSTHSMQFNAPVQIQNNTNSPNSTQNMTIGQSPDIEKLFNSILTALVENSLDNHEAIKTAVLGMKETVGQPTFKEKYDAFVQSAANHMTVFLPFMSQLAALLASIPLM